ncbi:hypothetical protein I6N95_17190 [Vagococcus sp. BWB3-3]|uniref:Uncharacterized protein n=1 Tax=Vagococcus allomyrinae TaxID=2794353 RepID=A0A940P808_9ENTE|nr:hypothetical protein [Vagococcus allomyrinae]MBP1042755.1 hypothetical protein [Vagococcus allomyrinae]
MRFMVLAIDPLAQNGLATLNTTTLILALVITLLASYGIASNEITITPKEC